MPYTAPSKQSPSAQPIEHPSTHSNSAKGPQAPSGRPHLPRSYCSTAYVRKHRRGPSVNKPLQLPAVDCSSKENRPTAPHANIRQSPSPLTDAAIPPGAVISPPESAPNSSDEDSASQDREDLRLGDLEASVRSIDPRQDSPPESPPSADRAAASRFPSAMTRIDRPGKPASLPPPKKFSVDDNPEDPFISSPEESDRDDLEERPPMVRKKSGELVRPALRPASAGRRPSSMPGTPTFSKAVHFDSQLEHIRHFLQLDKPVAVSAETSPVDEHDTEGEFPFSNGASPGSPLDWELRLPNFPKDPSSPVHKPVRLERLSLSSDSANLVGVVAVANLAFNKQVATRFTFDFWKTVSEVTAEYTHDVRRKHANDGCDRFSFSIKLADQANLESKTMFACIRYTVNGKEYWDNNNSMNYQVGFSQADKSKPEQRASPAAPRPPLPRSRSFVDSHLIRPHSTPPSFDDFSDMDSYLTFGRSGHAKGDSLPRDMPNDIESVTPVRRDKQSRQAFGNRYDFGASLSAVMRTKPTHDRTTLTARAKSGTENVEDQNSKKEARLMVEKSTPVSEITRQNAHSEPTKSSSLVSDKPRHESTVYKELVDKYCFVSYPFASSIEHR